MGMENSLLARMTLTAKQKTPALHLGTQSGDCGTLRLGQAQRANCFVVALSYGISKHN